MLVEEKYMWRSLQLALNGKGAVSPNPMVGAVIVCDGKIIGEGFHRRYGCPHAEVNAINSVKDKSLLTRATMYVSLEPCSHYGKTPPCSDLIIEKGIPNVVIACLDPYPSVAGRGAKRLRDAGVNVASGILEKEALELNKEFIAVQQCGMPYVYLKWAQSQDGFIDKKRESVEDGAPAILSNSFTQMFVHKKRSEVDAIMVGTNTAVLDNPRLNSRLWHGKNPCRILLDKDLRLSTQSNLLNGEIPTIIFTEKESGIDKKNVRYISISFDENLIKNILFRLKGEGINSLMVEGGRMLLQSFIDSCLWDEALIEIAKRNLLDGVPAPMIKGRQVDVKKWGSSQQIYLAVTQD